MRRRQISLALWGIILFIMMIGAVFGGWPHWFLEAILVVQWGMGVAMLSWVFSAEEPMKLAAFPSCLLTLTVLRLLMTLGLVQSYLMQGEISGLALWLGELVVESQPVAGIVVYVLLLMIQFVVLTKGSDRVSEVAARFSLDALPGQQMSIDADLRAGLITISQAARRREQLLVESRLFGAMDGAIKFVRGDVIASAFVTIVTLVAAWGLRTLRDGLPHTDAWNEALPAVIGLSLSGIIPSILSGMAAGILVTRPRNLVSNKSLDHESQLPAADSNIMRLRFAISPTLAEMAAGDDKVQRWWDEVWPVVKERMKNSYPFLQWEDEIGFSQRKDFAIAASIEGITLALWSASGDQLSAADELWNRFGRELPDVIEANLHRFVRLQDIRNHLNDLEKKYPDLVREAVPRQINLSRLTELVRQLVEEKIPLVDMTLLLETLTRGRPDQKSIQEIVSDVRLAMSDYLIQPWINDEGELPALILDTAWEKKMEASLRGDVLALPPEDARLLREKIVRAVNDFSVRIILLPVKMRRASFNLLAQLPLQVVAFEECPASVNIKIIHVIEYEENKVAAAMNNKIMNHSTLVTENKEADHV